MQKQPLPRPSREGLGRLWSASESTNETAPAQAVGTTTLYENGQIKLIPAPTPDPRGEPLLGMSRWNPEPNMYFQIL
jgi:hypothetical protein